MTHNTANCASCPLHQPTSQEVINVSSTPDRVIALAGNPNTGKSTLFNALTGLRQHVGNWPGKTVARAEGNFVYGQHHYRIVDLPGTYSLLSTSVDEEIARDYILFGQPDVTVIVIDATRLERNLNLALQILEITGQVVVALNLMDEAQRHGIDINIRKLSKKLGVPVVPMTARRREGIDALLKMVDAVASGQYPTTPHHINGRNARIEGIIEQLTQRIRNQYPDLPNARWVALRLLDGDTSIEAAIQSGKLGELNHSR